MPEFASTAASEKAAADAIRAKRCSSIGQTLSGLFTSKRKKEEQAAKAELARKAAIKAAKAKLRAEKRAETKLKEVVEEAEFRDGYRVNPRPAVTLTVPKRPPPLDAAQQKLRDEQNQQATAEIASNLTKYIKILKDVSLFSEMGKGEHEVAAQALECVFFKAGEVIYDEGDEGTDCWVLEEGTVVSSMLIPGIAGAGWEWKETRPYKPGNFGSYFGERGLRRGEPRPQRMTCRTDVKALRITQKNYIACARIREYKENLLRGVQLFEQMTDEEIGKLAAVIEPVHYSAGEKIISQGAPAVGIYLIESGEVLESNAPPPPFFASRTYRLGEIFGESALKSDAPHSTTVSAVGEVSCFYLSRESFETQLGPLADLQRAQLLADPRTLISDFYQAGDARGPAGTLAAKGFTTDKANPTQWFVVYRPCSRDSIAKMLGRVGVGKGLNIKGKSAQKNRLSGFVPFLQISNNDHKPLVEASPKDARTKIFYKNVMAREEALATLTKILREAAHQLDIAVPQIWLIRDHEPHTFGLDVPEPLVKEAYIMRPDISPTIGWETGRPSVPAFMDMNLHGVRGDSKPRVCLFQHDLADPMNPCGLLISYAEAAVKPVCSDFDTFTVGSRGMKYEPTPPEQVAIVHWELDRLEEVLQVASSDTKNWAGHWLGIIKREEERGYHPEIPEFGFGEPTSTRLIQDVIQCTSSCGAVRHGAECFNYWFPQELDKDFLVIWDGFQDPPWQSFKEEPLRKFLIERAKEGYSFPLNPCWPVRDPGWYEVMQALKGSRESVDNQNMWFPPDSGIAEKIERLHSAYPSGFKPAPPAAPGPRLRDGDAKKPPPPPLPPAHAVEKDLKKEASPKSGWFGDRV